MKFLLKYHEKVVTQDLPKLSSSSKQRIKSAIEKKLLTKPELFGIPLRRSLKGYRKLRVGDYRIIFRIENATIKILAIQHRSIVYESTAKRSKNI